MAQNNGADLVPSHIVSGQGDGGLSSYIKIQICGLMHTLLDHAVKRVYARKAHIQSSAPVTHRDIRRGLIYEVISPCGIGRQLHVMLDSITASANHLSFDFYDKLVEEEHICLEVAMTMKRAVAYAQFMTELNLFDEYKRSLPDVIIRQVSIDDLMCEINEEMLAQTPGRDDDDDDDDDNNNETHSIDEEYVEEENEVMSNDDEKEDQDSHSSCESMCNLCSEWEELDAAFANWQPSSAIGELCVQVINSMESGIAPVDELQN